MNDHERVSDKLVVSFNSKKSGSKDSWSNDSNFGATSSFFSESKVGDSVNDSAKTILLQNKKSQSSRKN